MEKLVNFIIFELNNSHMKISRSYLKMICLSLILSGCRKDAQVLFPADPHTPVQYQKIYGTWLFNRSCCSGWGINQSPATLGYTPEYIFNSNGIYEFDDGPHGKLEENFSFVS